MTSAEIYQWMENPRLLTKSSLMDLKQMVDDFPYFHAVRMLYLKNLAVLNDVRLNNELKKMSVFVPDRKRLFMLIESKRFSSQQEEVKNQPVAVKNRPEEAVDTNQPAKKISKGKQEAEKKPSPVAATSDYVSWLEANAEDIPATDGEQAKLEHQDLIDSYIESETKLSKRPVAPIVAPKKSEKEVEDEDLEAPESLGKESMDDSYFTETLARVYARQKRYDKALEIIRAISLKYPEKNVYFADQIRYLERIINIKK